MFKIITKYLLKTILLFIGICLCILLAGFFAIRWGLTNVAGEEDFNSNSYNQIAAAPLIIERPSQRLPQAISRANISAARTYCKIKILTPLYPREANNLLLIYQDTNSEELFNRMLLAINLRLGENNNLSEKLQNCDINDFLSDKETKTETNNTYFNIASSTSIFTWQNGEPWQIIKTAITKDKDQIELAAKQTGVQPRLLVSVAIVEQLRLYYTQREFYEKFFKPLKILANANKMAWGIMSIKEKMAISTEDHLLTSSSPFYLGKNYESLLAFTPNSNKNTERYRRLTNEHDHYYSYLYGALIIRQFQEQWRRAGYDLAYRPEILATLFNIGFDNSHPNPTPKVGGSTLEIDTQKYSFGSLAFEFYYSGELIAEFPFK